MQSELALLALLVAGYALIAARLDRYSVGPALTFLLIGVLVSEDVLGPVSMEPGAEPVKLLAEITLTLLLFADASEIPAAALRKDARPILGLLVVGLPLTIILGTLGAVVLFPGMSLGVALLIAATLAPTDAALGQPVITNPNVPARIRRLLNVESGLNDGIAAPIVFLAIALATTESSGTTGGLATALTDIAIGTVVGVVLGFVGGAVLVIAEARRLTSSVSRQLFVLALAVACYLVAGSLGGNGFIAAFVGGLAFGVGTRQHEVRAVEFTEIQGSLLAIGVWAAFGLTLAGKILTAPPDPAVVAYAVLSLTVIRMVPVAVGLLRERFRPMTVLFIGWFGPRGLASIVFVVVGLEGLEGAGVDTGPLGPVVAWTVVLSVILHGLSAGPLAARYGRYVAALGPDAPELGEGAEPRPARTTWAGRTRAAGPAADG
jgi:sodium/hydrogen antiporter